jgi:large repetitive protein
MRKKLYTLICLFSVLSIATQFVSCSKPDTTPPAVTCASKTIVITGATTATSGGTTADGSITTSATGSTGFTYSLNTGAFQSSGSFAALAAGTYTITAKDDAGCIATKSYTVTATACPTITITGTTTNTSSPTATNGTISSSATGSTGITYSKDGTTFQATGNFTGLAVGSYTITAKDVNGCLGTKIFVITSVSCPTITVTSTTTQSAGPTATNGSITATAAGGVAPYTYSKDGVTFQASNIFAGLTAGNYTIVAKDANTCLGSSATIAVTSVPCPTITIATVNMASDKCTNNNGSITANATGGAAPYSYSRDGGVTFQASNLFMTLPTGNYALTVKDVNGCTANGATTVGIAPAGPTFTAVKAILATNCAFAGCHGGATPQSGINFADDCTIVSKSARIKARGVDNIPSVMPPSGALSAADKQKILDWIAAGGQHSN